VTIAHGILARRHTLAYCCAPRRQSSKRARRRRKGLPPYAAVPVRIAPALWIGVCPAPGYAAVSVGVWETENHRSTRRILAHPHRVNLRRTQSRCLCLKLYATRGDRGVWLEPLATEWLSALPSERSKCRVCSRVPYCHGFSLGRDGKCWVMRRPANVGAGWSLLHCPAVRLARSLAPRLPFEWVSSPVLSSHRSRKFARGTYRVISASKRTGFARCFFRRTSHAQRRPSFACVGRDLHHAASRRHCHLMS